MKKTAVILFPEFCNYEISVLMEILALNEKPVAFLSSKIEPFRCEEGMKAIADFDINSINIDEFDSLVITGSYADGLYYNFGDETLLNLIRLFNKENKLIAAVSSGPMLLCKAGVTDGKKIIAGVEREWFLEDPKMKLTEQQMETLLDVNDLEEMKKNGATPPEYILDGNILTACGWKFREWAFAFGKYFGLECYPLSFGLD
ncbi:MAG: DJ-1/PfpI family protein [Clostridia bacterium]|nr:DJ-1/PfpI family protein [Clostridia bacterium]